MSSFQNINFAAYLPAIAANNIERCQEIFEANEQRVYALAFWMTDNEMVANELLANTFRRVFSASAEPAPEQIDRALLAEVREIMPVGALTLRCADVTEVVGVRRNVLRTHLERAVVQLPATERLIFLMHDVENYDHARIARTLGISEDNARVGLHQARLRMRELLAGMAR